MPQPYLVPVNSRFSRRTQSRGVEGSTSTFTGRLFTLNEITGRTSSGQKTFVVEELVVECYRAGASTGITYQSRCGATNSAIKSISSGEYKVTPFRACFATMIANPIRR